MSTLEYPNYSVYRVEGGQLKNPLRYSKRVVISTLEEARVAAVHAAVRQKNQMVIMEYTGPYIAKIVEVVNY